METKHTPGPWVAEVQIEPDYMSRGHFCAGHRKQLVPCAGLDDLAIGTKLYASTPLTDAAPELLAALRACVDALDHIQEKYGVQTSAEIVAREVIAKATGAAP